MNENVKWALLIAVIVAVGLGMSQCIAQAKKDGELPVPTPAVSTK